MVFKTINTGDKNTQLIQSNISSEFNAVEADIAAIQAMPFQDGKVLKSIALNSSSTTTVAHGLGFTPTVTVPVYCNAAANVYNAKASDGTNIYLKASATCVVNVWVG